MTNKKRKGLIICR